MLKIGPIIAAKLEEKDLTQKEVAEKLHINPKTFSTYVNDVYFPPLDVLRDICQTLDIDLNHLLDLESHGNLDLLIQGANEERVCKILRRLNKEQTVYFMHGIDFIEDGLDYMNKKK